MQKLIIRYFIPALQSICAPIIWTRCCFRPACLSSLSNTNLQVRIIQKYRLAPRHFTMRSWGGQIPCSAVVILMLPLRCWKNWLEPIQTCRSCIRHWAILCVGNSCLQVQLRPMTGQYRFMVVWAGHLGSSFMRGASAMSVWGIGRNPRLICALR